MPGFLAPVLLASLFAVPWAAPVVAAPTSAASTGAADLPADHWQWPLSPVPEVLEGFDPPTTPYGPGHSGVDLLGWAGQSVTAVAPGTVSFAGQVGGKPVVVVDHGGERSTYEPVVAAVQRGDTVVAGQALGTLTSVAGHCLPLACLHLGRKAGDTYLDPLELLGGPVRLLPRHGDGAGVPGSVDGEHTRPGRPPDGAGAVAPARSAARLATSAALGTTLGTTLGTALSTVPDAALDVARGGEPSRVARVFPRKHFDVRWP